MIEDREYTVRSCARCDQDHNVNWKEFTHPHEDLSGEAWTHWTLCPNNGEPILMMEVND